MKPKTAELWTKQNQAVGDRRELFVAVAGAAKVETVLYPGSYVDISPSFVFGSVTYVDSDRRTPGFFKDLDGITQIIAQHHGPTPPNITFIHADYTTPLDIPDNDADLLVSLYGGFISEHCTRYLRIGGTLLVNSSHGDAALASINPRYQLAAAVISRSGRYRITSADLESYLIPKKPQTITAASLYRTGRGIAYTRNPFAYLFTRVQ